MLYPTRNTAVGFIRTPLAGGFPTTRAGQNPGRRGMFTTLPKEAGIPDGYGPGAAFVLPYTSGRRVSWVGNEGVSAGVATGAQGRNSTGDGTATSVGVGSGVATFDGAAAGASVAVGVATGVAVAEGAADGTSTSIGVATGFVTYLGDGAGAAVSTGVGTGTSATSAAGIGTATSIGVGTGIASFNGAAVGAAASSGVCAGVGIAAGVGAGAAVGSGAAVGVGQFNADAAGSATSTGSAITRAIAWGSASNVVDALSPTSLAAAVWSALASSNNSPGTMGDLLNSAGGGGISGAVIDQIADAVWEWADTVAPGSKGDELAKALKAAKLAAALSA